jgi:putative endonuclease
VNDSSWYLYVVECNDSTLYTGITTDLQRRVRQHNTGRGATYTATRRPVRLIAAWRFAGRVPALKAEIRFKRQSRNVKLRHISTRKSYLDAEFVELDETLYNQPDT